MTDNQTALVFGVAGGIVAVFMESVMKRQGFSWWGSLWWMIPLAIFVNYAVYRMVVASPSLPAAIIIFSTATLTSRVLVSVAWGHHIGPGTWAATGLFMLGLGLRYWKP